MDFRTLNIIPFRRIVVGGVDRYIADLGNIRIQLDDPSVLVAEPVKVEDPYTGTTLQYQLGLHLPAHLEAKEILNDLLEVEPNLIQLVPNPNAITMVTVPTLRTPNRVGLITEVVPYDGADTHREFVFDTYSKPPLAKVNPIQGVITTDIFLTGVPKTFAHVIRGTVVGGLKDVSAEVELRFGTKVPPSPVDSFVAGSESEMLGLTIKLSDRCYRTDLEASFINVTGNNDTITDWRPLSDAGAIELDTLRSEFDIKLLDQEERLVAMIAALG